MVVSIARIAAMNLPRPDLPDICNTDSGAFVTTYASAAPQYASAGNSSSEIHAAALALAGPEPGLSWLDVGCGTGDILREIRDQHAPSRLHGTDILNWLAPDLVNDVEMSTGPAENLLNDIEPCDRVLMIELMEHLEAPWTTLRAAARLVKPGGRLVMSTPNLEGARQRLELLVRGQFTSFRPDNAPHLTPILPHVAQRILREEGFHVSRSFAGRDCMPGGGPLWPWAITRRVPRLTCISSILVADRPGE